MADRSINAWLHPSSRAVALTPAEFIHLQTLQVNLDDTTQTNGQRGNTLPVYRPPRGAVFAAAPAIVQPDDAHRPTLLPMSENAGLPSNAAQPASPRLRSRRPSVPGIDGIAAQPVIDVAVDISLEALENAVRSKDAGALRKLAAAGADMASLSLDRCGVLLDLLKIGNGPMERCLAELGVDFLPVLTRFKEQANARYRDISLRWFSTDHASRDWSIFQRLQNDAQTDPLSPFSNTPYRSFSDFYHGQLFVTPATCETKLPFRNKVFMPGKADPFLGSFDFHVADRYPHDIFQPANVDISSRVWEALFGIKTTAILFVIFPVLTGLKEQQIKALTAIMLVNLHSFLKLNMNSYPIPAEGFSRDAVAALLKTEQRQIAALEKLGQDGLEDMARYLTNIEIIDDCFRLLADKILDEDESLAEQPDRSTLEANLLEVVTAKSGFTNGFARFLIRCALDAIDECGKQITPLTISGELTYHQHQALLTRARRADVERSFIGKIKERIDDPEILREVGCETLLPTFANIFHQLLRWQLTILHGFADGMQEHIQDRSGFLQD